MDHVGQYRARRFRGLRTTTVLGIEVPVASTPHARMLGLAWLDSGIAGPGILLRRCRSVHTFGMRFALDIAFLDADLGPIAFYGGVGARRVVSVRGAAAVLEVPAGGIFPAGGESPGFAH